ncbi:secretion-regulating guanine nucleotide exchange factor-like [Erethizon dorsatum]
MPVGRPEVYPRAQVAKRDAPTQGSGQVKRTPWRSQLLHNPNGNDTLLLGHGSGAREGRTGQLAGGQARVHKRLCPFPALEPPRAGSRRRQQSPSTPLPAPIGPAPFWPRPVLAPPRAAPPGSTAKLSRLEREPSASEAAPAAAALFAWGANSYGQLGLGHKEDVLLPQQLADFCKPGCVRKITGGGGHSTVVTDGGGLFVCGLNKDGQLGLGHTEDVLCFTFCKPLGGCPIQQVACGWDFTIMLTENGQVLSCGSNSFSQLGVPPGPRRCVVPQAIELLREKVVCVAAGLRHALAAAVSGIVFQWGTGLASSGQWLSPEQTLPLFLTAKEPSRVTGLENSKAVCVLAGSAHSASLTDAGELYVWGSNKHGQLATQAAFLPVPQKIEACCFQSEKVTAAWSGWTHLVAQTDLLPTFASDAGFSQQ